MNVDLSIPVAPLTPNELALHERTVSSAKEYLRCEAALLPLIDEIDLTRLYFKLNVTSTFAYCVKHLGLSEATALNFINVARRSREVPELALAVETGELGIATARKIAPILNSENHSEWIEKARTLTKKELEKELVTAAPETMSRHMERTKPITPDRTKIEFSLSEENLDLLRRVQDLVSQKQGYPASMEEAIVRSLEEYVERHDPVVKAYRQEEKNSRKSQKRTQAEAATNSNHTSVSEEARPTPKTIRNESPSMSQDRCIRVITYRRVRIPASIRHAVNRRDRGMCQMMTSNNTKCGSTRFTDIHHRFEIHKGGGNTLDNLVTLCRNCHQRLHASGHAS